MPKIEEAEKIYKKRRVVKSVNVENWRKYWKEAGPVRFAEEYLFCPANVPPYPNWKELNVEAYCVGCKKVHKKFRPNGIPVHIILSEDQKEVLIDAWENGVMLILITAGRGAGKTFILSVWNCWRLATHNFYEITTMGGSAKQSKLCQKYIDYWRGQHKEVGYVIHKSPKAIGNRGCITRYSSENSYIACSPTAAMGPHVNEVQIDEECVLPNTEILTKEGNFVKIGNVNSILTGEGNDGQITKRFSRDYFGQMLHIQPYYNNFGVVVTPNHPIKIIKRKKLYYWKKKDRFFPEKLHKVLKRKPRFVKSCELKKNDILIFPIPKFEEKDINISNERLDLIGYYISEGSVGDHQIYFSNKDDEFIKDTITCVEKEFGKKYKEGKHGKGSNAVSVTILSDGTKNVYFTDKKFREWLINNCGRGSRNKKIPSTLMNLPFEKMNRLLKAILRGDGENNKFYTRLHVSSRKLVQQFWTIYIRRKILTTIRKLKSGYYSWCLYKKQSSRSYGRIIKNFVYVPIRKITPIWYKGKVKNLAISPDESYVVPYITLHNCAAESRGTEGMEAIEAIDWQITGRTNTMIWRTSTSHFILGKFYEILTNPKQLGYKVYVWGIANHISGKSKNRAKYTDRNPNHWIPACWWITKDDIIKLRKKSDEEWLCWGLGYPSLASGQVFKPTDIKIITCDLCLREGKECIPYKWGHCKLIEMFNLGVFGNPIKNVIDLKAGFDYGDPAPCALVIAGTKSFKGKEIIFILYAEEMKGLETTELYRWVIGKLNQYRVGTFYPDPSIGGKHVSEKVDNAGFTVYVLAEGAKEERVLNMKCIVERHNIIIPYAFWQLLNSMKMVHRDKNGKIKKYNDHSFDGICYVCSDWGDLEGNAANVFDTVFEELGLPKDEIDTEGNILLNPKTKGVKFWD